MNNFVINFAAKKATEKIVYKIVLKTALSLCNKKLFLITYLMFCWTK